MNEVLCVELSRYTEHCVEMKNGTLKQFAERLKENIEHHHGNYGDLSDSECNYVINETLKEFING